MPVRGRNGANQLLRRRNSHDARLCFHGVHGSDRVAPPHGALRCFHARDREVPLRRAGQLAVHSRWRCSRAQRLRVAVRPRQLRRRDLRRRDLQKASAERSTREAEGGLPVHPDFSEQGLGLESQGAHFNDNNVTMAMMTNNGTTTSTTQTNNYHHHNYKNYCHFLFFSKRAPG